MIRVGPQAFLKSLAGYDAGTFRVDLSAGLAIAAVSDVASGLHKTAYAVTRPSGHHCSPDTPMGFCMFANVALAGIAFYGAYFVVVMPYGQSRLQNLVWGRTRSDALQCRSDLRMWPLGWLTLKNLVLCILTLGLYWPFAAMAVQRLRVQAVQVVLRIDPQSLVDTEQASAADASGEAAGDLFGLDIGL